uniref:Abhydrolase domain containing 6, acylglycerol lipase n=1 Tax=Rousettus aegyptiacus TaxID=9407 RepID=A0A7J8HLV0_ROUAE|nr:abhydrolase domain containing 6, acylglycerol lipase [Rousettus aegyptiacus]
MDLDVVNMFVITGGMLAIPILAFVALFFLWPSVLIKIYYRYRRRALGMQVHYVRLKDYQFCYSFRGKPGHKPSILMLHEFSRRKDMWLCLIKVVDVSGADILAKSITTAKWKFWKTVGIQWWWRDPGSQLSSSSTF